MRATTDDGQEFTFRPSLGRIAALGSPHEIVAVYAGLHGPDAAAQAAYVLACLCDQEDATALIGWVEPGATEKDPPRRVAGPMPEAEQIVIARHLMRHGIAGKARPGTGEGKYSDRFDAAEYIAAARVHLGLSSADAEALSMTEFQTMFEMKFPELAAADKKRDVPTREEYDAAMAALMEQRRG